VWRSRSFLPCSFVVFGVHHHRHDSGLLAASVENNDFSDRIDNFVWLRESA
jgi:hypothetical protein